MSLQTIRQHIDQLDSQLVHLLNERMRQVTEIGRLKRERGQSVYAPEREELLLQELERQNQGPLSPASLRAIYREILSASRANQSKLQIIYLGTEDSRSFLAARTRFGASDCYRGEHRWSAVLSALTKKEAEVAVVSRECLGAALLKKSGSTPFLKNLRVCGEINLWREIQTAELNDSASARPKPEQFFVLTSNEGTSPDSGKSICLLNAPRLKKPEEFWQKALHNHGVNLFSAHALHPAGQHFLCEIVGETNLPLWQEKTRQNWGRTARLTSLGVYPNPQIYG
jgi:chorismate mutase-like protein